jgi:multidrug efflux pump subunit AcrB
MIRASIENPYAVFVGVIILVIFSVISYYSIPVQLKPTIEPLQAQVRTFLRRRGAGSRRQITNKLERSWPR